MTRHPERPVVDAHQHSRDARNSLPRLCDPQPIWFRHRNYDALRLFRGRCWAPLWYPGRGSRAGRTGLIFVNEPRLAAGASSRCQPHGSGGEPIMPLPRALPAHALAVLSLVLGLGGCAVIMAASGEPEPDLSVCTAGATAEQIEAQLGAPNGTQALPNGGSECRYAFWKGDPPSYGRAAAHAAADVLTYGLWEVIYGTRMEATGDPARRYEMRVTYDADGRARDFVVERLADEEVEVLTGQVIEGAPLLDRIDARIGVHYPPELEDAVFKDRRPFSEGTKIREFRLRLGSSVVQLFDAALGAQFAAVEAIDRWPPTAANQPDVTAVIEPRLEEATLYHVKLGVTLYRPDGEPYGAWAVIGRAQGEWTPSDAEQATARVEFALRNAAVQLLTQFRDQAPVQQWLAETGAGA